MAGPFEDDPLAGTPYRTLTPIGEGGMGTVWLAEHRRLGRSVAVKLLKLAALGGSHLPRFELEAQAQARLQHENLVEVQDFGFTPDGRPYLVMPHLKGRSLRQEVKQRGYLPLREARRYMLELFAALEVIHEARLVHRDLKPTNVFLVDGAQRPTLKVLDLGLLWVLDADAVVDRPAARLTEAGMAAGTPRYMAPEQALEPGKVDVRTDLYAAGLLLYFMIVGRGPFDRKYKSAADLIKAHVLEKPPAPSTLAKQRVPPELDELVMQALAKDQAARPESAAAFGRALRRVPLRLRPDLSPPVPYVRPKHPHSEGVAKARRSPGPQVAATVPAGPPLSHLRSTVKIPGQADVSDDDVTLVSPAQHGVTDPMTADEQRALQAIQDRIEAERGGTQGRPSQDDQKGSKS